MLLVGFVCLIVSASITCALAQKKRKPDLSPAPPHIQWNKEAGVSKYRLQIAYDKEFTNVVFDGAIAGSEYEVRDLSPGHYYWRIAPAESATRQFSKPSPLEISAAESVEQPRASSLTPRTLAGRAGIPALTKAQPFRPFPAAPETETAPGWITTTGEIAEPMLAHLRDPSAFDLVGVNREGTVYALDGSTGIPLWTARFHLNAGSNKTAVGESTAFIPVVVDSDHNQTLVVVAFDGGVRALSGDTGRELWRADLSGHAVSGMAADFGGTSASQFYLIDDRVNAVVALDLNTGHIRGYHKLTAPAVAPPIALAGKNVQSLLVPVEGGAIEIRDGEGTYVRSVMIGAEITTRLLVVDTARGTLVLAGTKGGLVALDASAPELGAMGRVALDGEFPRGALAAADLNGDGRVEVVLITNTGRAVAVSAMDGKIKWSVQGAAQAWRAGFADLNGDGRLDVLLPGKDNFAVALSGLDGSMIWKSDEKVGSSSSLKSLEHLRSLATLTRDNHLLVVGSDASSVGLRALCLSTENARSASH